MRFLGGMLATVAMAASLFGQQSTGPAATQPTPATQSAPQAQASSAPQAQASSAQPQSSESSNSSANSPVPPPPEPAKAQAGSAPGGTAILLPEDRKELAEAKRLFKEGVKFKSAGHLDEAFEKFQGAAELAPHNVEYLTAREFTRQQLVMQLLKRGNQAMLDHDEIVAMAEFRRALEYDPTNDFAMQRLRDSMPEAEESVGHAMRVLQASAPVTVQASQAHHDFHYRGDAKTLLTQVAQAYGLTAQFDDSVQSRRVRFEIENVGLATAITAAEAVTKTFHVALSAKQVLFLADTAENRRSFERMALRTFYLPDLTTEQQLTETVNSLRVILNLRYIAADKAESTISIRAEVPVLEAAQRLLESLSGGRPEVMLDMKVYEISSSLLRQLGNTWPSQFTMFNVSPGLIAGLGQNSQNLINQLIASGGINQANSQAIQALLAQLQQSSQSSILSTPFATFGGGLTLFGLAPNGPLTINLNMNESDIRSLDHVTLRASQNDAAVLKVGQRYPIINATFAPIYNTSAIASVIGNQSYTAPFPSFNFEDLGLDLKATPTIHADKDVTLKLELKIRSLGTQNVNGIPIINNREYSGTITAKNDEASVVASFVSRNDVRTIAGLPFAGQVPGASYGFAEHTGNIQEDELFVVITPHIVRLPERASVAVELPPGH